MPQFFSQACPVCGRQLHVHSSDANAEVACEHCHGVFIARPSSPADVRREDWRTSLMKRADELLALAANRNPPIANASA